MIDFNPQKLTFENLDRFYIKRSIYQFLCSKWGAFYGDLLDIGCGEMPYKNEIIANNSVTKYVGLDIFGALEYNKGVKPDYFWDGKKMPFEDGSYDSGFATEVLEHCPDPLMTLTEINRVLKPDSPLILTVPFLWPTHESPHDFYRFTPFVLKNLLEQSGFTKIEITCLGGWDASMAQLISLWIKRRGFSIRFQKFLFIVLKPFILKLYKKDNIKSASSDHNMFTGLGIVAWKK
ncbi:Methyltransferase domain-containing protein [Algoriphagus faecimaris]|uniref:Methyltransferase domain-containing protein n=1 Tax=Algoriphagus faecimaris TaxID=686796 RepID=A0A1G6PTX5_9BACT|nr:class I SAM-dependent methyltransferase [Algoriphagus faecimaris]SDC82966.1 Methyltransferase domain-containing protein [Algoriphagus faecimaris]